MALKITTEEIHAYFRSGIVDSNYGPQFSPGAQLYIEDLLVRFVNRGRLFGDAERETLVDLMQKAIAEKNLRTKKQRLHEIGDICLFAAGFFQGQLSRKTKDLEYCVEVGSGAYAQTASLVQKVDIASLFLELGQKFRDGYAVVAEVLSPRVFD